MRRDPELALACRAGHLTVAEALRASGRADRQAHGRYRRPAGIGPASTQRVGGNSSDGRSGQRYYRDELFSHFEDSMSPRPPRRVPILVLAAAAVVAIVAILYVREPLLRAAGWALVVNEPVAPADIIVVTLDSSGAGALEAADLVQSGIAKRVAVFVDPPSGEDHEFIRRGLPYEDASARQIRQLRWLGVTDVVQIPRNEVGTEGEVQVLPQWCDQRQFRSIVLVAARDHSRRLRRVLDRVMKGHPTGVIIQAERYSSFDPDRWWKTREGVRTEIIELEKLVLDAVLHPMPF
jgi:hypothetical protein